MLKDDGSYNHIAWVPSKEESGNGGLLIGLEFDKADNIYVAYKAGSKYEEDDLVNPFQPLWSKYSNGLKWHGLGFSPSSLLEWCASPKLKISV